MKILFISATALKEKSVIQNNVDEKILTICIKEYQEIELRTTLGATEYNRLSDELVKVQNGTQIKLTDDDQELFDMITPVMVYGSLMYSISPLHEKITNKGMQHDKDLNADIAELGAARSNYNFKLDKYRSLLLEYIHEKDTTTTKKCCASSDDTTFNFTGIALDDYTPDVDGLYKSTFYKDGKGRRII